MLIYEYAAEIENQIDDLFAQKTAKNEFRENLTLLALAVLGVFDTIDVFADWFNFDVGNIRVLGIAVAVLAIIYIIYKGLKKE